MFGDMKMRTRWTMFAAALSLAGCASHAPSLGGDPQLKVLPTNVMPVPTREDAVIEDRPYYIGAFDKLTISVFGVEELSKVEIQTDGAGRLSFPLVGIVDASGKTPAEVEAIIAQRLRVAYIRNPHVTVNLRETVSQTVTVDGDVTQPGIYPIVGPMTLLRAVATAKGTNEFAKLEDVVVFRTVKGQKYAALYNLKAIREGVYADPDIYANDLVTVGDSRARHVFKDVLTVLPAVLTPIIILLQRF